MDRGRPPGRLRHLVRDPGGDRSDADRAGPGHPAARRPRHGRGAHRGRAARHVLGDAPRQGQRRGRLGPVADRGRPPELPRRDAAHRRLRDPPPLAALGRLAVGARRAPLRDPARARPRVGAGVDPHPVRAFRGARDQGRGLPAHRPLEGPHRERGPHPSRPEERQRPGADGGGRAARGPSRRRGRRGAGVRDPRSRQLPRGCRGQPRPPGGTEHRAAAGARGRRHQLPRRRGLHLDRPPLRRA